MKARLSAISLGRGFLIGMAVVLLAGGVVRLGSEFRASLAVTNMVDGFRNADGFGDQVRQERLRYGLVSGDPGQVIAQAKVQLETAPFDPVLMAVLAHAMIATGDEDLAVNAAMLDQAHQIAPRDRLVQILRDDARQQLQYTQPKQAPSAE